MAAAGDEGETAMVVGAEEEETESVCRLIRSLKAQQQEQRSVVDRRSITLRKKARLLEALQDQLAPQEGLIRQYLKTIYEADRDLVETLTAAKHQLSAMDSAVERPVVVGEVLRYARVVRPITAAPKGWTAIIPWIPRDPFKPGNVCIAASRLRKYQTEIEEQKREREKLTKEMSGGEAVPPSLAREATAKVIREFSHSTEFEPPPDWKPGQPIDIRPDVVAKIRHQVEEEGLEQARKRGLSVSSEGEAAEKREEPPMPKPAPPPPPPPQQPVVKKPKKQTFMMDDDEDEDDED